MKIELTGFARTPSWETLQKAINEASKNERGRLVQIQRKDNGVDYRSPGDYNVGYRTDDGSVVAIHLVVTA